MRVREYIDPELAFVLEKCGDRDDLLREMTQRIAAVKSSLDADELYAALIEREGQGATSTPEGVAFPHAMVEGISGSFVAVAKVPGGCDFQNKQHGECDLIFLLVGPTDAAWEHLRLLARLARICHTRGAMANLRGAKSASELYERVLAEDAKHG